MPVLDLLRSLEPLMLAFRLLKEPVVLGRDRYWGLGALRRHREHVCLQLWGCVGCSTGLVSS